MYRGRENAADIEKRLARTTEIKTDLENCIKIQNDTKIEDAGNALINIISVAKKLYI
jgi:ribose 1,5-bisphosphokinase